MLSVRRVVTTARFAGVEGQQFQPRRTTLGRLDETAGAPSDPASNRLAPRLDWG